MLAIFCSSVEADTETTRYCLPELPQERDIQAFVQRPSLATAHTPHILLVVLDTLRADRVTAARMPNLKAWLAQSHHAARTLAAATSTEHSLFSSFFMRPAFEREALFAKGWSSGSPALQIARAVGYEVNLFAYPSWYACPMPRLFGPHPGPWSNRATFELLFGSQGALLRRCPHATADRLDESDSYAADRALIAQYLADLDQQATETNIPPPRFDILHLYGAHDPYGVDNTMNLLWPIGEAERKHFSARAKIEHEADRTLLRATYDHAVTSLDRNIKALLQGVHDRDAGTGRLIVMVSDHGETLPQDAQTPMGHGMAPSQDQTEVIMGYAGGPLQGTGGAQVAGTASTMSLFPTLLKFLRLHDATSPDLQPPAWVSPSSDSGCHFMVQPRQAFPPNAWAVSDGAFKLYVRTINPGLSDVSHAVVAQQITTMDDHPLPTSDQARSATSTLLQCLPACPAH